MKSTLISKKTFSHSLRLEGKRFEKKSKTDSKEIDMVQLTLFTGCTLCTIASGRPVEYRKQNKIQLYAFKSTNMGEDDMRAKRIPT